MKYGNHVLMAFFIVSVIGLVTLLGVNLYQRYAPLPTVKFVQAFNQLHHPADIVFANERYWIAQIYSQQLLSKKQLSDDEVLPVGNHLQNDAPTDSENLAKVKALHHLRSPHFVIASDAGVYVSEGWGQYIKHFPFDKSLATIVPLPEKLRAPHGICLDKNGWLYIADSLHSRLVRTHLATQRYEVFADNDKRIAYVRQIECRDNGIWLANSYEKREGLNTGEGSNVLHIKDFSSGTTDVIVAFPNTNVTGLSIIDDSLLLVGRWLRHNDVAMVDLRTREIIGIVDLAKQGMGVPYGIKYYPNDSRLFISFLGGLKKDSHPGGVLEFSVD